MAVEPAARDRLARHHGVRPDALNLNLTFDHTR
jgi:hypothetical protein